MAHTRSVAYMVFREHDLGQIKPGMLADMIVLDRDYLTVPPDEIVEIRPVTAVVGGRSVFSRP